jgi:hypothetical protein
VTPQWIAQEVASGRLSWILDQGTQSGGLPGDTRTGSQAALDVAERVATKVTIKTSSGTTVTLYKLSGKAAAILRAAGA